MPNTQGSRQGWRRYDGNTHELYWEESFRFRAKAETVNDDPELRAGYEAVVDAYARPSGYIFQGNRPRQELGNHARCCENMRTTLELNHRGLLIFILVGILIGVMLALVAW